ncbi:sugar phosphate isomerase/epimerase [Saccharopolyspora hirsuta]|uniref:Sugar phosphate isomerase/epimerase n=1 Tax=Saccharopolyspora hirsuta TaxID=1837 RepID=A0A5M7BR04_SACHI|nr:EboA domain-containing protein [Saccharopolyspora hirsuta]KAA5830627.1 sugar phosphate isomerase/epimerase [Saccharopolyspora hirsuta]
MSGYALGYGTNGFADHRLPDALEVIAELGYTAVAMTLDHPHLDPFARDLAAQVDRVAAKLSDLGLRCVVETGARYLLDPRRKHHPTLLCDEPGPRLELLTRAVRIAGDLGAECTSFWSGARPPGVTPETAWHRLVHGVAEVLEEADRRRVRLGFEPEPGMFVERLDDLFRLRSELGEPDRLGITLDVGHVVAVESDDIASCLRRSAPHLVNVQLDDMRTGVHEHLEFGAGEVDLVATLATLTEIGYTGVAAVELPRHSHAAPAVADRSMSALRAAAVAAHPWVRAAEERIGADPTAIRSLFPAAGRHVGRGPLRPEVDPSGLVHGTTDDHARTRLLAVLAEARPDDLAAEVVDLHDFGDGAERRGVLRGLSALPGIAGATRQLLESALRSNDPRLVVAALSGPAAAELDQHSWRHGVLKCLFLGVPLEAVADLERRSDAELARMVADYATERRAAGRSVPADVHRFPAATTGA